MPSLGRWLSASKSRSGRRPLRVSTLLKKEKAGTLFKFSGADRIHGGLADDKKPDDFPASALAKGVKVEREHTDSAAVAREIAMDHLTEDEDYYDKLERVEKHAASEMMKRWHERLLERRGEKEASATHEPDYADNQFDTTGLPALRRKKPLELPSRDEVDVNPNPKVEQRQDSRGTLTVGDFATPGGFDDLGKVGSVDKISAALETLGQLSRAWEVPSDDEDQMGAEKNDHHGPFGTTLSQISASTAVEEATKAAHSEKLASIVQHAFLEELQKIAEANGGILPWVGGVDDFREFIDAEMQKHAFSGGTAGMLGGVRRFGQQVMGRLRPQGAAAAMPEVQAFRKGTGFFSTGMSRDLAAGGKALAHNPQAAGRAAGLGAKDLGSLQAMRPTSAGRRIAGEVAHGAGHHINHASPLGLALNPIGTGMGGAIEGAARGVGKELQTSARAGVQTAGRLMQRHAPKIGLGGELVAGGLMHAPGLASVLGGAIAPSAGGIAQHALGEGAQRLGKALPRVVPRLAGMAGRALG